MDADFSLREPGSFHNSKSLPGGIRDRNLINIAPLQFGEKSRAHAFYLAVSFGAREAGIFSTRGSPGFNWP